MNVNIFVNNQKLDLFKDESIEFISSVQSITDITKLTTDFSRSFSLPATDNNNKIFKHFYNSDLINGFDARVRQTSRIEFGGQLFKEGVFQLNKVTVKNGKPATYSGNFYNSVVGLKDVFEGKKLTALDLSSFDFDINYSNVKSKLLTKSDLSYTLLSKREYYYNSDSDTTSTDKLTNIDYQGSLLNGVQPTDLRPSVKLETLVNTIKNDFSVNLEGDIFNAPEFTELYLTLNYYDGKPDDDGVLTEPTYIVSERVPDVTIMDFIRGIMNIFKLIIIYDVDTNTYTFKNITSYYNESNIEHFLSEFIDDSVINISKVDAPKEVKYRFKEPKTRSQKLFNARNNYYYGDLDEDILDDNEDQIVGRTEAFTLPFEVVLLERLNNTADSFETTIQYGLCTNDELSNQDKIPFLHYIDNKSLGIYPVAYTDGVTSEALTNINTAVFGSKVVGNYNFGCIFTNDIDTYNGNSLERNFFSYYHYENVTSLFDKNNRMVEFTGYLPYTFMLKINLNDTIVIKGSRYRIDTIKYNLNNNKSSLRLYKLIEVGEYPFVGFGAFNQGFSNGFFK